MLRVVLKRSITARIPLTIINPCCSFRSFKYRPINTTPSVFSKSCNAFNKPLLFNTTTTTSIQRRYFTSNAPSDSKTALDIPLIEQARDLLSEGYQKQVDGKHQEALEVYKKCVELYQHILDVRVQSYREETNLYTRKAGKYKGLEVPRASPKKTKKEEVDKKDKDDDPLVFTIEDEVRLLMGKTNLSALAEKKRARDMLEEEAKKLGEEVIEFNAETLSDENEKVDGKVTGESIILGENGQEVQQFQTEKATEENKQQEEDEFEKDELFIRKVSMDEKLKNKFQESYELAIAYLNYAELFDILEKREESEKLCRESLSILQLGIECTIEENEEKFEEKVNKKERMSQQEREWTIYDNEEIIAITKGNLAEYMIKQKKYVEAIPYARDAFEILLKSRGRKDEGTKEYFMMFVLSLHQSERGEEVHTIYEQYPDIAEDIQEGASPELQEQADQFLYKFWNKFTKHVSDEDIDKMEKMGLFNADDMKAADDLENQEQNESGQEEGEQADDENEDDGDNDLFIDGLDKGKFESNQTQEQKQQQQQQEPEPEPKFKTTFEMAGHSPVSFNAKGEMTEIEGSPFSTPDPTNTSTDNSEKSNPEFTFTNDPEMNEILSKFSEMSQRYEKASAKTESPFEDKPETPESQEILNQAIEMINFTTEKMNRLEEDKNDDFEEALKHSTSNFEKTTAEIMNDLKGEEKEEVKRDFSEIENQDTEQSLRWIEEQFGEQEKEKLTEWMEKELRARKIDPDE
eukprot:TRINITY_DN8644_c0_g1_i1.p1 TRINITY_DN8644_c0_g1~~TRINITY_DN8644_c0_g1_i1.p1  ORF type:complete len:748 (-),score=228.75 TRINITY_DN8644_c0_g1_i1:26-2269(-)